MQSGAYFKSNYKTKQIQKRQDSIEKLNNL
jgi:hypothetical protein